MSEVLTIAAGTWRRILRMRVVYFLIICVLILIASAFNYDILSMQEHKALMIDVSLVLNTIAAIITVISITFEIPKEIEEGVASTLLTKPLGRTQYLAGKLVGIVVTAFVICALIAIGFFIIFSLLFNEQVGLSVFQAHTLVIASIVPMAGIAVFFASFLQDILAAILTFIAIWFSYSAWNLSKIPFIYGGIVPDLDLFNFKAYAVYGDKISWSYILIAFVWGIVFTVFATAVASLIFRSRDIK